MKSKTIPCQLYKLSEEFSDEKKEILKEIQNDKRFRKNPDFAIEYVDKIEIFTLEEFFAEESQNNYDEEDCKPEDCADCEDKDDCDFDFENAAKEKHKIQTIEEAEKFLAELISNGDVIKRNGKYLFLPIRF